MLTGELFQCFVFFLTLDINPATSTFILIWEQSILRCKFWSPKYQSYFKPVLETKARMMARAARRHIDRWFPISLKSLHRRCLPILLTSWLIIAVATLAWNWCFRETSSGRTQTMAIHGMITKHIKEFNPTFSQFTTVVRPSQKLVLYKRKVSPRGTRCEAYLMIAATSCRKHRYLRVRNRVGGFPWRLMRYSLFPAQ